MQDKGETILSTKILILATFDGVGHDFGTRARRSWRPKIQLLRLRLEFLLRRYHRTSKPRAVSGG
jgi:hypothetical protein